MPFSCSEPFSPRPIRPLGVREHNGWRIKVYSITYGSAPLDLPLYEQGLAPALASLPSPAVTASRPGLGFVICHQGRGVHYLVLNWWDNENEFSNRVFVRPFASEVHLPAAERRATQWRPASGAESACVWDLEVIWHERNAYVRHVLTPPGGPGAAAAYLADQMRAG